MVVISILFWKRKEAGIYQKLHNWRYIQKSKVFSNRQTHLKRYFRFLSVQMIMQIDICHYIKRKMVSRLVTLVGRNSEKYFIEQGEVCD